MSQTNKQVAKQDTVRGSGVLKAQSFIADAGEGKTWKIEVNAEDQRLKLSCLTSAGTIDTTTAQITIDMESLNELGLTAPVHATFRLLKWKDAAQNCDTYQAAFLMTQPQLVTTP